MTTMPHVEAGCILLDGRPTMLYVRESMDGVLFASGMQGLIAIMYTAEAETPTTGESRPMRVCMFADLAIPQDTWRPKVRVMS